MEKTRHFEVTIKEVGREKPLHTSISGKRNEQEVIDFFGLHQSDVEWFRIEEVDDYHVTKAEG